MPSQLLEKLKPFFDQGSGRPADQARSTHPLDMVMRVKNVARQDRMEDPPVDKRHPGPPPQPQLNFTSHWPEGWGGQMTRNTNARTSANNVSGVNTIAIHETSGWPGYAGVQNMVRRHLCIAPYNEWDNDLNPPRWATRETDNEGIGPQYYVDANGTVFALIGEFDLGDEPRITYHSGRINGTSIGIENGDTGDAKGVRSASNNPAGPYWARMSTPATPDTGDMPGLVCFALLHPASEEADLNLIWFSTAARGAAIPDYPGSGDTSDITTRWSGWTNMIFTERDYRSLALLVRLLFEKYGVPRNFCILPYSKQASDGNNHDILRKIILADERQDMMAHKFQIDVDDIRDRTNRWTNSESSALWSRFFGVNPTGGHDDKGHTWPVPELPSYRGVIAHAYVVGGHPCPGPLFDWHRFAREVWDWWWYPFDLNLTAPADPPVSPRPPVARREYMNARGDTALREYYYDAAEPGADFTAIGARVNALAAANLNSEFSTNHFALDPGTPVYAMANGVVVAARLQNPADPANPPFILIRHEVFHQADQDSHAIDYDHAPSIVWTLTTYLDCHAFDYARTSNSNPDWLNRMLIRLKECELAVAYKAAHPGDDKKSDQYKNNAALFAYDHRFQQAWNYTPTSNDSNPATASRPTTGKSIKADADEYRRIVNSLRDGNAVLFPLESAELADGEAHGMTPVRTILGDFLGPCGTFPDSHTGVQTEIFSLDKLAIPGWIHVQLSRINQQWWKDASASNRLDGTGTKSLPKDGLLYSYPVTGFLDWLNQITWKSEWRKYEVVDAEGTPVAAPDRPKTRIGL